VRDQRERWLVFDRKRVNVGFCVIVNGDRERCRIFRLQSS